MIRGCRNFLFVVIFSFAWLALSCEESAGDTSTSVTLDDLSAIADGELSVDLQTVYQHLNKMSKSVGGQEEASVFLRKYYQDKNPLIWVRRSGVCDSSRQLLDVLKTAEEDGFSTSLFRIKQIEKDLQRIDSLDFDEQNTINEVLARLELNLSKAYFCYAAVQQYGAVNPTVVLNKSQVIGDDTIKVTSRQFDMKLYRPDDGFFTYAATVVPTDSFVPYLEHLKPQSPLYQQFKDELKKAKSAEYRKKVLVNMERARWHLKDPVEKHDKYVLVNVASQKLVAMSKDSTMTMKVCCGTTGKKTPLLNSYIKKMDINPVWRMPYSIVKTIAGRAGNAAYFSSRRYSIYDGAGRKVNPAYVTSAQLRSGKYSVVQAAGKGNSLGRIIFRFDNNFSVYLHDTNSPWVFKQANRCVSHGCVRLERPFDMAVFLLGDKQADKAADVKYSMTHDPQPKDSVRDDRMLKECKVDPEIPVYLTYYTLFPDRNQHLREYNDVYGYDKIIYQHLKAVTP